MPQIPSNPKASSRKSFTVLLFGLLSYTFAVSAITPISVSPSQRWEGNDGNWSTFNLRLGTPTQEVRVLIGLAGQETWVIAPGGCVAGDPSDCLLLRGGTFNLNQSSSWVSTTTIWNNTGIYELTNEIGDFLGISSAGEYGFDTVGLGWGSEDPSLNHTIVASVIAKDYFLGQFGISPRATNFTVSNYNSSALTDPQPSYLSLLKKNGLIPSLSWGFNPGSYSRSQSYQNSLGSLTLGGYDPSRSQESPISIPFAPDNGRELVIGIQAIRKSQTGSAPVSILTQPVLAAIDSTQPNMWLPISTCSMFESAFNLDWNNQSQRYEIDDTTRNNLLSSNASITFTLGSSITSGVTVDIVLPYSSFDLMASYPLVPVNASSVRYFPLKRAKDISQFTLGRVFLQETYVIADYERSVFSIAQARWDGPTTSNLVAILPIGTSPRPHLSTAAIAGIAIGVGAFIVILTIAFWRFYSRSQRAGPKPASEQHEKNDNHFMKPELDDTSRGPVGVEGKPLQGTEVDALEQQRFQLDADEQAVGPPELQGEGTPAEADVESVVYELPGEDQRSTVLSHQNST